MCFALSVIVQLSQRPSAEDLAKMSLADIQVTAQLRQVMWDRYADTLTKLLNMSAGRYQLLITARHDRAP